MILQSDARHIPLADERVHCCITSPPYWGLRDYGLATWIGGKLDCDHRHDNSAQAETSTLGGSKRNVGNALSGRNVCPKCGAVRHDAGIGLEKTPEEYVANIAQVFREVWRVLRNDGTLWLNLGDCYANNGLRDSSKVGGFTGARIRAGVKGTMDSRPREIPAGLKPKDLVGIPWRVAFALQADGWYLRSDIIWHKPNPMPESVRDRPTKAHEYLFLLAKQPHYFYDAEAIKDPSTGQTGRAADFARDSKDTDVPGQFYRQHRLDRETTKDNGTRNRRDVWTIPTHSFSGAHFATFPPALVEPCILAGCPPNGIALDPFCGSGTVGQVCRLHGRRFIGLDLSMKYLRELALPRAEGTQAAGANDDLPLFEASGRS